MNKRIKVREEHIDCKWIDLLEGPAITLKTKGKLVITGKAVDQA